MNNSTLFFNRCFDKKRLKSFILWFFSKYGERKTIQLIENLKEVGFKYATKAGISIGIDDLKIPFIKSDYINITEQKIKSAEVDYQRGNITKIERQQRFVEEWSFVSEKLKRHVIQFFKATDVFNPIYMMAFSGARGNISQIRQLIGMRGLMADPQGQILDFPIRSSFREGLTLTEYLISCYGARKGVVDTALRTATSGYLTRRLVDVTQQVVIGRQNCYTRRGIQFTNLMDGSKNLLSLKDRLIGRVLLNDIIVIDPLKKKKYKIGFKNQEVSTRLAKKLDDTNNKILLRSPLTCCSKNSICQLCYGWNLAYNAIVSIGEAVGVLAAQSIGEPGTQLTMRTFHTGGVFTGGLIDQIYAPFNGEVKYINNFKGILIRTLKGRIGFLTKIEGALQVKRTYINDSSINQGSKIELSSLFFGNQLEKNLLNRKEIYSLLQQILAIEKNYEGIKSYFHPSLVFSIPIHTILFIKHGSSILEKELIAELSSLSISDSHRQETEQEVFAPMAGQIFFEKLTLIEKMKRDGSIQKMTYGLGSLWVASSLEWPALISPHIFLDHGDFVSGSSVIQKIQISAEKFYHFDKSISNSLHAFENFKAGSFLKRQISGIYSKPNPFDSIILNRAFYSNNFRRIYYKNFRYFVITKNINNFSSRNSYLKNTNLSIGDCARKRSRSKVYLKHLTLGLNFRFYQNNTVSRIQKQKSKISFLLYSIQNEMDRSKDRYFFSLVSYSYLIESRLKKPITSRKVLNFSGKALKRNTYQYWYDDYFFPFINIMKISSQIFWIFSQKRSLKNFDFTLPKRSNNGYLSNYFVKIKKTKIQGAKEDIFFSKKYKVSKFFSINFICQNFVLYNNSSKTIDKYKSKSNWLSAKQAAFILVNRQSDANLQISKLWRLSTISIFSIYPTCIYKPSNNNRSPHIFSFFIEQVYNIKQIIKPILISSRLFVDIYSKEFCLNHYVIQNFLIFFYYEYFINLRFDNYFFNSLKKNSIKIGFQTQFKILTIPIFIKNKTKNNKIPSQIKRAFLKNEIFSLLQKTDFLKKDIKKQQNILSWPCTYKNKFFTDEFGYCLNYGTGFKQSIHFDRHPIVLDIVYNKVFFKFDLLNLFSFYNFHKLKIRFFAHRLLTKNLVVFQKIENYINPKFYYSKILNLNNNYNNREYYNSLAFNSIKNYFINFNRNSIKKNKSTHLFFFDDNLNFLLTKKIFFKAGFFKTRQIRTKTLFNLEYPILLKAYSPLRGKESERFNFHKPELQKNSVGYYIFNNLVYFSLKNFYLNSIQKLNFQGFLNSKIKQIDTIRIFYKKFKYCSIKDLICVDFFSYSQDTEIIDTSLEEHELKKKFTALTKLNLKAFRLENPITAAKSQSLMLNNFLRYGTIFENQKTLPNGGQVIYIDKKSFTIRAAIPFLITPKSLINVHQNELIKKGSRLFTFLSYQVKTGDIIQGIPKIEEFFEARLTRNGLPLLANLHAQIKQLFQTYKLKFSVSESTQKSFEKIQYLIINEIQKVYCSQGIYISDKHLEIVVRQMTSKVQVINGGRTGFLCGELIEFDWMRLVEQKFSSEDLLYEPIVLGITKSCLETESFISAASFQETTRILTKAALQNKIDFIRGLKQNVILGNLVPAGTGFFSPLYIKYLNFD